MRGKIIVCLVCVLMFASTTIIEAPGPMTGPVTEEWVEMYDGGFDKNFIAQAMAVDSSGNTYVTGGNAEDPATGEDYVTVKYDTNGNLLWSARYKDPANDSDHPYGIVVDELSGNVYVTGICRITSPRFDIVTVAYDSNGNQLWVAKYQGTGNGMDVGKAITLDPSGNVIVVGRTYVNGEHNWDFITLKYDRFGNALWEAEYDGPANLFDMPLDVTTDAEGNIYVTGIGDSTNGLAVEYPDTEHVVATVKYDPSGKLVWAARYNGPGSGLDSLDVGYRIAVDPSGNVYVTGWSMGVGTDKDYITLAYGPDGEELWSARYNAPANGMDEALGIALGPKGEIYVTGTSYQLTSDCDYVTIAYDAQGNELWISKYNGPENYYDGAYAITTDILGYIYVTGESIGTGTLWDCTTIKYDSKGNQRWVQRYNGPENDLDKGIGIGLDSKLNVYVAGWTAGEGMKDRYDRLDYLTIKYSQDLSHEDPVALAGPDQTVYIGATVNLDGSDSFDFNGIIVDYEWDFGDGSPYGNGATTTHIYTIPGIYTVTLTVTDGDGMKGSDTCTITVKILPEEIGLSEGWNLISLPRIQLETDIASILASIEGEYDAIQWFDARDAADPWKHFNIQKPSSMNDLKDPDHTMGLWIHVTAQGGTTLNLDGEELTTSQYITLYPGWNMVGYPAREDRDRTTALNNVIFGTDVDKILRYNSETQTWEEVEETDSLGVGNGYWMHSLVEKTWEIPNNPGT